MHIQIFATKLSNIQPGVGISNETIIRVLTSTET